MAKSLERFKARELRKQGESIKVIAKKLQVSPSSVSLWCEDVKLSSDQIKELERRAHDPHYGKRLEYSQNQQKRRIARTNELLEEGKIEIGQISKRELFLIGIALYWAEGFKKDSQVGFANSNPEMIKLYLKWLFECCNIAKEDLSLRVTVNFSHEHRIKEIEEFWSSVTRVEAKDFQKPFFQKVAWKKSYEHPEEYFGVLRIKVRRSTDFLRKIHGWIEGLRYQA